MTDMVTKISGFAVAYSPSFPISYCRAPNVHPNSSLHFSLEVFTVRRMSPIFKKVYVETGSGIAPL